MKIVVYAATHSSPAPRFGRNTIGPTTIIHDWLALETKKERGYSTIRFLKKTLKKSIRSLHSTIVHPSARGRSALRRPPKNQGFSFSPTAHTAITLCPFGKTSVSRIASFEASTRINTLRGWMDVRKKRRTKSRKQPKPSRRRLTIKQHQSFLFLFRLGLAKLWGSPSCQCQCQ